MNKHARLALALAAVLAASGCATLVPATPEAQAGIPATWPMPEVTPVAGAASADGGALPVADIGWRDFFADPRLEQVVALALHNNRDLRVAILNVERARAQYRIQRADRLPSLGASVEMERVGGDIPVSETYTAGVGLAAFELDLFGRVRNLGEAALQQYLATEEAQRSAQLSLVAEVANAWLTLAADQEQLRLSQQALGTYEETLELTGRRYELGATSALEVEQVRTQVATARTDVERLKGQVARDLALEPLDVGARGGDLGAHLLDLERGGRAQLVAPAGQLQRLFVGAQRLLRQPQLLLVGGQRQPGVGDLGHQRQLRRTLRLLRRQVLLQRRLAEVAHAAEQVEFERGQADAGGVGLADRDVAAHALHLHRRAQRRQAVGALDAVLRPCALDVEDGHAQVAVVVQRQRDHLLQPRVGEEVAPADVGHRKGAAVGTRRARDGRHLGHRPGGGDPGLRFGRGRHQGGAAAGGEDRRQGQREACVLIHARWLPCSRTVRPPRPWPSHRGASGSPRRTAG